MTKRNQLIDVDCLAEGQFFFYLLHFSDFWLLSSGALLLSFRIEF